MVRCMYVGIIILSYKTIHFFGETNFIRKMIKKLFRLIRLKYRYLLPVHLKAVIDFDNIIIISFSFNTRITHFDASVYQTRLQI